VDLTRRELLRAATGCFAPPVAQPVFDIHCHTGPPGHGESWLLRHQRALGITGTALLPVNAAFEGLPSFNVGQGLAIRMSHTYPGEFVFFAIADPRKKNCPDTLRKHLQAGARGIGEMKFPVTCDSPKMEAVYELAAGFGVPVLLHFQYEAFNTGFERFPRVAAKYPGAPLIGHGQTWWGNIDRRHRQEQVWPYPEGRVTPDGFSTRLLREHPNVYGEFSGQSGWNALARDEEHARWFLGQFQDKLLFGSDCLHRGLNGTECWGRLTQELLRRLAPSAAVLNKILWENARRLLELHPAGK
jgi:predicted TIM-barrel fold metal-dependent hydrolase